MRRDRRRRGFGCGPRVGGGRSGTGPQRGLWPPQRALISATGRGNIQRHVNHAGRSSFTGGLLRSAAAVVLTAGLALASAQDMEASGDLRVLGFGLPDEIATVRVDTFEAAYPDVNLEVTEGAIDQQQLLTAIASGRPPDR